MKKKNRIIQQVYTLDTLIKIQLSRIAKNFPDNIRGIKLGKPGTCFTTDKKQTLALLFHPFYNPAKFHRSRQSYLITSQLQMTCQVSF